MKPADLGLPPHLTSFRSYPGFDQYQTAKTLANSTRRVRILNAATGSGKSVTYSAAAALLHSTGSSSRHLVLVGTKDLQHQLHSDRLVKALVYSHRNYPCASHIPADDGDDPEFTCAVPRSRCGYVYDIDLANRSNSVVTNYAFWMSLARFSDPNHWLGEFDLLVLDEAHNAPDLLSRALTIELTPNRLHTVFVRGVPELPEFTSIEEWEDWTRHVLFLANDAQGDQTTPRERRRWEHLVHDLERLLVATGPRTAEERWVVCPFDERPYGGKGVRFAPRWGTGYAEQLLFRGIPHIIMTSASVTKFHADCLGVKEGDREYWEVPSPFDRRKRPVVYLPTVAVDYRMSAGAKWKLVRRVDEIIEAAIDQGAGCGVIHTGSYERNREIVSGSRFAPLIITHGRNSREYQAAIGRYKEMALGGKFAVIASPRMQEGVDLKDRLGRWQVIVKMPSPDSRDPLTKARMEDPGYRDMVVAEKFKQMVGRLVRGMGDWGVTFVLDDHWGKHMSWQLEFQEWFRAAFVGLDMKTIRSGGAKIEFLSQDKVDGFVVLPAPALVVDGDIEAALRQIGATWIVEQESLSR